MALTNRSGHQSSGNVPFAVIGTVTDNKDADLQGKVKVKFQSLDQTPESHWLRWLTPNGGKERGLYAIPEVDDEVLIIFLHGSQDAGIVIGGFWNGQDGAPKEAKSDMPKPADTDVGGSLSTVKFTAGSTDTDKNDRRLWKSRSGHLFVMDDTDGSESVTLWDKTHKLSLAFDSSAGMITLANNNADLHIRAKGDLILEAVGNIKFKSGKDTQGDVGKAMSLKVADDYSLDVQKGITEKAQMDIAVTAQMNFTAKATMNVEVNGSMNGTFKGGMIATLEGGTMAKVKGAMVMIN